MGRPPPQILGGPSPQPLGLCLCVLVVISGVNLVWKLGVVHRPHFLKTFSLVIYNFFICPFKFPNYRFDSFNHFPKSSIYLSSKISTQICLLLQSHHFLNCSPVIFLYIMRYSNISWNPTTPHDPRPKILGSRHPNPPVLMPMVVINVVSLTGRSFTVRSLLPHVRNSPHRLYSPLF